MAPTSASASHANGWSTRDPQKTEAMSKGTARRSIRVGDLWDKAQQVAEERGDNLSDIIRQALEQYVKDNQETQ